MTTARCAKCQSTDVRVGSRRWGPLNKFPISFWKNAVVERHVCITCGFMEQYVTNPDDRAAIAEKWSRGGA